MDTQQHEIKKSLSGRESHGVYVCHKCGWPFAKAHPSAKHRRAHKKLCGTIEGYKLFESDDRLAASDGERAPSEDQQTPGPVVDKRGGKELGSSGPIGLQSNRSVDDVFSDAVAEFSDNVASPATEDLIKDLSKDMEKLKHSDSAEWKSCGGEATAGTPHNSVASVQSIKTSNPEVEHVISQLENANSPSDARIEDSPAGSIGGTLQFDTSPEIFETPTDELIEGINEDVKDEDTNKTLTNYLNPHMEFTSDDSPEPYSNEIDKQASDNLREELSPVADIEKQFKLEAKENHFLDFVTRHYLAENDISSLQKHPNTEDSVTEFDGNKSGDQSEVQHIVEESEEGKDMPVSLFKMKKEETTVSNSDQQTEADIAVYSLSVLDSLAGIANAAHLIEDFKDYASPQSSLPLDLWSVGDDKQSTIAGQSVAGVCSVDPSGGINSSITGQNTLKDNLNEKVEMPMAVKSCVSGSAEESVEDHGSCSVNEKPEAPRAETESVGVYDLSAWDHDWRQKLDSEIAHTNKTNIMSPVLIENSDESTSHVGGDDPDQNKMSKFEESDDDIKQCSKRPMGDQLAANDKRTRGTDSSFLVEDDQVTSSLKVHQIQVLKGAAVELSEGNEFDGPTQKSSDLDVQQSTFDSRTNLEQIAYKLSQIGTRNVIDNTWSVASAVKNVEENHNDWILLSSEDQGAFITNEVRPLPVGSESLQGKGNEKLETQYDGVSVSISSSRADGSMDGNLGSVSVVSLQSDTAAIADRGGSSEKSQTALQIQKGAAESDSVKSDDFELPSFMTSVELGHDVPQRATPSDVSALNTQQQKDEDQKASWFPSISNEVNESQGRKRNEIIANGSNRSSGREHSPLKSLLGEAKSPNSKQPSITQKDEISTKSRGSAVTTVDAILRSEPNDKEIEKEWDSPARYPVELKKEKRKRRPYWVPFVCCSSVERDL